MTLKEAFDNFIGERIPIDRSSDAIKAVRDNQRKCLFETLNDAQKIMLQDYEDTYNALNGRWDFQAYTQGLVDGIQITRFCQM